MKNVYEDDELVGTLTDGVVRRFGRILEFYFLADKAEDHVAALLTLMNFPEGAVVLDAGCGVGEIARLMATARPDLRFILQNISASQLDMCPPFMKLHGSFENIPLPDASVDAIMFNYSLGHGDLWRCFAEARRILRPGGILSVYDLAAFDPAPMKRELGYTIHAVAAVARAANWCQFVDDFTYVPNIKYAGNRLSLANPQERAAIEATFPIFYRFTKPNRFTKPRT
mgnify:CR=1 FL=1